MHGRSLDDADRVQYKKQMIFESRWRADSASQWRGVEPALVWGRASRNHFGKTVGAGGDAVRARVGVVTNGRRQQHQRRQQQQR